jgi:hypothetical protein
VGLGLKALPQNFQKLFLQFHKIMFLLTQILFNILFFAAVFAAIENYNISGTGH